MAREPCAPGSVGSSNVPGNPLRSYRMSMLSHGFVDGDDDTGDFTLDETEAMTYSVMRPHDRTPPWALTLAIAVVVGAAIVVAILTST